MTAMAIGLLGRKVGMTQIFDDSGNVVPVTVIEAGPCHVLQLRTKERDGYEAVQVGFLDKPRRLASRAQRGQVAKLDSKRSKRRAKSGAEPVAKADCEPQRYVREFRVPVEGYSVGQKLDVNLFAEIKRLDVIGTSKGRGTAGVMVRHNMAGQRASHGVKKVHRHCGSIGQSQFPGHVPKGRRMAGQHGNQRRTSRNLQLVRIDAEHNLLLVNGAVPGPNGGYVMICQTNKV
jgi:large subunit ribosomal protein L3